MPWRITGFILAIVVLVSYRLARRNKVAVPTTIPRWSLATLVLASALTLFAELAIIRWVATEVRIFAYVKNLALLLCFLGFGLGCALSRQSVRWATAMPSLLGLILIVRLPWRGAEVMESLSQMLGAAQDVQIWVWHSSGDWVGFVLAAGVAAVLLLLICYVFIPLGQVVSRQIELAPRPLYGYSWNLAGSLAGILVFFGISWLALPPTIWFLIVLSIMAILTSDRNERFVFVAAIVPMALLLFDPATQHHFNVWTPYQQIELEDSFFPNGEFRRANIRVNHTGYQLITNLSPEFLARHPELLKQPPEENPYNLPFRFTKPNPRVLIVGAGSGNDVAAALRNGSSAVDAVEIDPTILRLGQRHPEHPYSDPRVTAHLTDARAFMKRAHGKYDLILFGLLDSHTQLSDYSNMRLDNFVYTEESFREARALLTPDGVMFIKFQVNLPWVGRRLERMLTETFGKQPVTFFAPAWYTASASCFAISESDQVQRKIAVDPSLQQFLDTHPPQFVDASTPIVTTDDWPYLYHQGRWIPTIFYSLSILVILMAVAFYFQIPEARTRMPSLFFFCMGAGFLLLETQVVSRLALYFGTTWQVNGIVIAAILSALLLANFLIEKQQKPWPRTWMLAGILLGVVFAYFAPFSRIPGSAAFVGAVAAAIFAIPVFFAGLLFASEFRNADSPAAALAANMLGAVVGGLLENVSLITGLRALLIVAGIIYLAAGLGFRSMGMKSAAVAGSR